jgi:hypothetical protein
LPDAAALIAPLAGAGITVTDHQANPVRLWAPYHDEVQEAKLLRLRWASAGRRA